MAESKLRVIVETQDRELGKLQGKLGKTEQQVGKLNAANKRVKSSFFGVGAGAKGAAVGVNALTTSVKGLLGPVGILLTGVAGLTAAFKTLESQNFAEAKVRSLGVNSKELVTQLKAVSKELKGQASVAELTGAAYDVASAGFNNAADAAKVLKAASLGATGGFSDIDTVANATTSVLNAYGLSADKAGKLVDGFIQTQNDGKIVIGEYARNIGKLAPIAASLGVPLEDINGAIAAVTANGVNAEVGITALRSALAKLGSNSKDATEILAGYGVQIDATTIGQEGLLKTLQKLQKVTDKSDLLKIVGTEAGQAIAPLLNDLEKLERLIANQGNVAGAAAAAQTEAANTIKGAWTEVSTAFSNLFSEQSELANAIIPILQGVAAAVEALNSPTGAAVLQIGALTAGFVALDLAVKAVIASSFVQWFGPIIGAVKAGNVAFAGFILKTKALTIAQAALNKVMLLNPWVAVAAGITAVGVAAFTASQKINAMREKMNDLSGSSTTLKSRMVDIQNEIAVLQGKMEGAGNSARGMQRKVDELRVALENLEGQYSVQIAIETFLSGQGVDVKSIGEGFYGPGGAAPKPKPKAVVPSIPTGGGSSGGGGGGGGGAASRESQVPQLQGELKLKQELLAIDKEILEAQFQGNRAAIELLSIEKAGIELAGEIAAIKREDIPEDEKQLKIQTAQVGEAEKLLQLQYQNLEADKQRKETLDGILSPIQDEIELLQGKLAGNEEEIRQKQEILRLEKAIAAQGGDPGQAAGLVKSRDALKQLSEEQDAVKKKTEALAGAIAGSLTDSLRGLIDGSMSAEEALANAFQGIADAFLDMAMQMIQEWLKMQLLGIIGGAFGGGGGAFGGGGGAFGIGGAAIPGFADGGRPTPGQLSLVGEEGPELFLPDTAGTVIPNDAFDAARGAMSSGGGSGASEEGGLGSESVSRSFAENTSSISTTNSYMRERSMETNNQTTVGGGGSMVIETQVINNVEYATVDQVRASNAATAKKARAQVFSDMKNKPAIRRQVGVK